jgi:hypothetical protein
MSGLAADLARRLARDAELVCRHYLSHGSRQGRYWIVGDVQNTPGRSLYVRLNGAESGPGAAGKWTDAATLEHGDLLDLIALNRGFDRLSDTLDEARSFLALPRPEPPQTLSRSRVPSGSPEAARRLFHAGRPIAGTLAEAYLRARGITASLDEPSLRFHPSVYYRAHEGAPREVWPALLAAVTDLEGRITAVHRTWLDPDRRTKAPLDDPRRALGNLLGNGVRFGVAYDVLAAGEGLETMLAVRSVLPRLPMVAGLSANHLAMFELAPTLRRLYVARDNDAAGRIAAERLHDRGAASDIEIRDLVPVLGDFNVDLWQLGPAALLQHLVDQFAPSDRLRFVPRALGRDGDGAT